ncbi:MAG: hypothetical protein ACK4KV_19135 [Rhodocyclaceae bacterium]
MNNEIDQLGYALNRQVPDMEGRGFIIGTSYGEIEVGAEEGRAIARALKRLLERKYAAACRRRDREAAQ